MIGHLSAHTATQFTGWRACFFINLCLCCRWDIFISLKGKQKAGNLSSSAHGQQPHHGFVFSLRVHNQEDVLCETTRRLTFQTLILEVLKLWVQIYAFKIIQRGFCSVTTVGNMASLQNMFYHLNPSKLSWTGDKNQCLLFVLKSLKCTNRSKEVNQPGLLFVWWKVVRPQSRHMCTNAVPCETHNVVQHIFAYNRRG